MAFSSRNKPIIYIAVLPCCRDRFGQFACQALRKSQPATFEKRCLSDHDFHTIDCCMECRSYIENNKIDPDNARSLFKAPQVCKDKRSIFFCRKFKTNGIGKFSCADAQFAIRVCRASCGYCSDLIYGVEKVAPPCQ
ncbi:hypothetical protein L596_011197 [Steinernema carpocapsae]|uniref:Uncharacterized protein n=1 Tax=Steinernema carpocapsae TaxID=34508 RepID=A0A4U5NT08_STECR|nr:hypothetical protein L596_011197 [Steinernema carpocapsae]